LIRVVELTKDLIRIPSENPPGNQKPIADFIERRMKEIGMEVDRYDYQPNKPNVVGKLVGKNETPVLMLNGHVDTVPAGDLERWTTGAFEAAERDGRIYGRGACDMKGGVAAMICAAEEIANLGLDLKGTLLVACVVDEEVTGYGTKDLLDRGYTADFGIVCEPTALQLELATKGALEFEVVTRGKPAHASNPRKGINAIYNMSKICLAFQDYLAELEKVQHPLVGKASISVGKIEGGTARNVVPEKCRIEAERRILPGEKMEDVVSGLRKVFGRLQREDPELRLDYNVLLECEPSETPADSLIVRKSAEAVSEVTGKEAVIANSAATTDMRFLVNQGRISTINLGPGGGAAHIFDEYIETEQLTDATKIYSMIAQKLLNRSALHSASAN
jgi:acetylornithine deacetylase/succinyl-diaminopimelate desuccinylase family protein